MTDPASHLIETFEDGIATLTMNRPETRNALSPEMRRSSKRRCPGWPATLPSGWWW